MSDSKLPKYEGGPLHNPGTPVARNATHHRFLRRYFAYKHLPPHLQLISAPFCQLAEKIVSDFAEYCGNSKDVTPDPAEMTVALRKLKEAKDSAVSAYLNDPAE